VLNTIPFSFKELSDVAFVEARHQRRGDRVAIAKISGEKVPFKSMGDGINRILHIILSMVNAQDGYLLIDEFENGLHYSVQEQVWKVIFSLAKSLNVQSSHLFIHSNLLGCLRTI
jgi:AAA15 family ATPase/GTPase